LGNRRGRGLDHGVKHLLRIDLNLPEHGVRQYLSKLRIDVAPLSLQSCGDLVPSRKAEGHYLHLMLAIGVCFLIWRQILERYCLPLSGLPRSWRRDTVRVRLVKSLCFRGKSRGISNLAGLGRRVALNQLT